MDAESQFLAEKDAEIERLQGLVKYHCEAQMNEWKKNRALNAEIERLRALVMSRIAEAGGWQELHEEISRLKAEITQLKSDPRP